MKRKYIVRRVKSWKESPYPETSSRVKAFTRPPYTIYALENTSLGDIEHEKYHIDKKHLGVPKDPMKFAEQEIEATLFAYNNIKRPRHILGQLRAIFNDLTFRTYKSGKVSPNKAKMIIKELLFETPGVPTSWKEDYFKFFKEYKEYLQLRKES